MHDARPTEHEMGIRAEQAEWQRRRRNRIRAASFAYETCSDGGGRGRPPRVDM